MSRAMVWRRLLREYESRQGDPPSVVLLGDSVALRVSRNDRDKRPVHRMLADQMGGRGTLASICDTGYHSGVYYWLARVLQVLRGQPLAVLLPVNIRSMSPSWDWNPLWRHSDQIEGMMGLVSARTGTKQPDRFGLLAGPNACDFRSMRMECALSSFGSVGQFLDTISRSPQTPSEYVARRRQIFAFHYTYAISKTDRKVLLMAEAVSVLREMGIDCGIYFVPINFEAGNRFLTGEFQAIVERNVRLVSASLSVPGDAAGRLEIEDLSTRLGSSQFFSPDDTTEHLNESGRDVLTCSLVGLLHKLGR